jgi:hypothetical protein
MQFTLTMELSKAFGTREQISDVLMHTAQTLVFNEDHPSSEALEVDDLDILRNHHGEAIGKWEVTKTQQPSPETVAKFCALAKEVSAMLQEKYGVPVEKAPNEGLCDSH